MAYPWNPYNYYPQAMATPAAVPTQNQSTGPIWIQGEAAAKSYLVAPGTTVALWDSESQTIYLKSADASGMPSMRILDYTIRDMPTQHNPVSGTEYATKADVEELRKQIAELMKGANE